MKICKDCKHFLGDAMASVCKHPNNYKVDLITGNNLMVYPIQLLRSMEKDYPDSCTFRGFWFEAKSENVSLEK